MKISFITFLLLFTLKGFSQEIYKKISFKEAIAESNNSGKIILLQLESLDCEMCNYVVAKAFENDALSKKIKETFIPITVSSKHADRNLINGLYDLRETSFGTLFIDGNKNLVHRFDKTTTLASDYDKEFDVALYKNSEIIKLNIFEQIYSASKKNIDLENWMLARKNLNLSNDSLLNIYANNLSADSINSIRVLTFIAKQAPLKGSMADNILRKSDQFNLVWYAIPSNERISINNKIISKSMQKAILEKNELDGISVANFARAVHSNKISGKNSFNYQAMKYYEAVVDMEKYMHYATLFYDSNILKTTVDDVRRIDSLKREQMMENAVEIETQTIGNTKKVIKGFSFNPSGQYYTNTLNEAAWFIYRNSKYINYLQKALEWASKANEYFKKFEAMDTEARIRYKLGDKKAAIELMEKAVQLKNEKIKSATAFKTLDMVLNNMKENKTNIDVE